MAVSWANAVKTAAMEARREWHAGGSLELLSGGGSVLAAYTLTASAGTVTNDKWTVGLASSSATGTAAAGDGTNATAARFKNASGTVGITGLTVGTANADIELTDVNISQNQTVGLTSFTITHAP